MKQWLLFFCITFGALGFGQSPANSLDEAIELTQIGRDTLEYDPNLALAYFASADSWFVNQPNSRSKVDLLFAKASTYSVLGQCDTAKILFEKAFADAVAIEEYAFAIEIQGAYVLRCIILSGGDLNEALKMALEINRRAQKQDDLSVLFMSNRLLIDIYWDMDGFKEELVELTIKNDELAQKIGNIRYEKSAKFDLAFSYGRIERYDLAIKTYHEVAKLQMENEDLFVSATYNNIAAMYQFLEELDSAEVYYKKGEYYSILQGREDGEAASNLYLGQLYLQEKKYDAAIEFCGKALKIFKDAAIIRRQEQCAACLQEAYEKIDDRANAYDYFKLKLAIEDSLNENSSETGLKLIQSEYNFELKNLADSLDFKHKNQMKEAIIEQQKKRSLLLYIGIGLISALAFFIFNRFRITRKQKQIIEKQQEEVARQHHELQETHKEITDSISYAKRIQQAILPPLNTTKEILGASFILYLPKDVVAGDFYWIEKYEDNIYFAAADCTGHGVPGAMVSVICNSALKRALHEYHCITPASILDKTREIVIEEFGRSDEDVKDGMDISLCKVSGKTLQYAGAHNPLWIIRNNEIIEIKGNKQPIGLFEFPEPFTNHTFDLQKGDLIYLFSDGFVDQFGGEKGKKLKAKKMREIFLAASNLPIREQQTYIHSAFQAWMKGYEQIDDVCIVGVLVE